MLNPVKDDVDDLLARWQPGSRQDLVATGLLTRMQLIVGAAAARKERRSAAVGLPLWATATLFALRRRGGRHEATRTELARELEVTQAAMTKRIRSLHADGLVTQHEDGDDARKSVVRLSARGLRITEELADLDADGDLVAGLSPEELRSLDRLVRAVYRRAQESAG